MSVPNFYSSVMEEGLTVQASLLVALFWEELQLARWVVYTHLRWYFSLSLYSLWLDSAVLPYIIACALWATELCSSFIVMCCKQAQSFSDYSFFFPFSKQISKALAGTDRKDLMRKLPKFIYDEEKALEVRSCYLLYFFLNSTTHQVECFFKQTCSPILSV